MDDHVDSMSFGALLRWRIVSALLSRYLSKELQVREGKDKVRALWTRDVITHDLGRQAPVIDVAKPGYAPFL